MTSKRPSALDAYLRGRSESPSLSPQHKHSPSTDDSTSWQTNFFGSKRQCLDELRRLSGKLSREEARVRDYLKEYQLAVLGRLGSEYQALKTELTRILDGAFERCIIRVKEGFVGDQVTELERAIKRLQEIKHKIRSFQFELQANYTYKRGIAHVVMEDFEVQRAEIMGGLNGALSNYEGKVFLRVEPEQFHRLKEAVGNIFSYAGHHSPGGHYRPPKMFHLTTPLKPPSASPLPLQPLNGLSEGMVPEPRLNPPFKPFPPKKPSQVPLPSQNDPVNQALPPSFPNHASAVRFGQIRPQSSFQRAFNNETQPQYVPQQFGQQPRTEPAWHYTGSYISQAVAPQGTFPEPRSRDSSPMLNSHRNRDLIRHSQRR